MLIALSANKDTFIPIKFSRGFNVVLADRTTAAKATDSRNARGKFSLISAINYCLGSTFPSDFRALAKEDWKFFLELEIDGSTFMVSRSCATPRTRVELEHLSGKAPSWLALVEDGQLSVETWKLVLGWKWFGLDSDSSQEKSVISARVLLSYLLRTRATDDPTKFIPQQSARSSRVHTAYLFGLDWELTDQLAELKGEQNLFKAIDGFKSSKFFDLGAVNAVALQQEREEAVHGRTRVEEQLRNFVLGEADPEDLVSNADRLTVEISSIRDQIFMAKQMIALHESSLRDASISVDDRTLDILRNEMKAAFTDDALVRLDEVEAFHHRMYENRSVHLGHELEQLRQKLKDYGQELVTALRQRSLVWAQISAGSVLDELLALQRQHIMFESRVEEIDGQIESLQLFQDAGETIRAERLKLKLKAVEKLKDSEGTLDSFKARFESIIDALYGRRGRLNVGVDNDGYQVSLSVPASASTGVSKMRLFGYDLTLLAESQPRIHPKFLIHDSIIFDGVDTVQMTTALTLVHDLIEKESSSDYQYIVMLNSNEVSPELADAPWFSGSIRRRILETEVGGAFGVVFSA